MDENYPIVFSDLDNTLFQTSRRLKSIKDSNVASVSSQGLPISYQTLQQNKFYQWLSKTTELIPVTGRSTESYKRVKLNFSSFAITTFGAVILDVNDNFITKYAEHIRLELNEYQHELQKIYERFSNFNKKELNNNLRISFALEYNMICHIKIKCVDHQNFKILLDLAGNLKLPIDKDLFYLHINENELCIIPKIITKSRACGYLLKYLISDSDNRPKIGIGDSISDLPFMELCDFQSIPKISQLNDQLNLSITQ